MGCGIEEDPLHSFREWGSVSTCVLGNGRGAGCACVIVEDPSRSFGERKGRVWGWISREDPSRSFQEQKGCVSTRVVIEDNVTRTWHRTTSFLLPFVAIWVLRKRGQAE